MRPTQSGTPFRKLWVCFFSKLYESPSHFRFYMVWYCFHIFGYFFSFIAIPNKLLSCLRLRLFRLPHFSKCQFGPTIKKLCSATKRPNSTSTCKIPWSNEARLVDSLTVLKWVIYSPVYIFIIVVVIIDIVADFCWIVSACCRFVVWKHIYFLVRLITCSWPELCWSPLWWTHGGNVV